MEQGVDQNDYSPEMFESIERGTAPWYRNQLIQNWLPKMPHVAEALDKGGTALDVGCGSGRAISHFQAPPIRPSTNLATEEDRPRWMWHLLLQPQT